MTILLTRRAVLLGPVLPLARRTAAPASLPRLDDVATRFEDLETQANGRLGIAAWDTQDGTHLQYRANERFPMCSTFKFLAASFVLARVDRGEEVLERRVYYAEGDLVPYSPVTALHAGNDDMTMAHICEAALTLSDNTAGNLLLTSFGGPAALTAFARSLGDPATRLDRFEPELNEARPGDPRDTTTPSAMRRHMQAIILGDVLSTISRDRLTNWLLTNKTGNDRVRAGTPSDWKVGDKTGTSSAGVSNDIAVVWPPQHGPLLIAAYLAESSVPPADRDAVLAEVARVVIDAFVDDG